MRLLLATDHYLPFIGGAHRQTHLLAKCMVARGHEVTVVTTWHGGLPTREVCDGITVRRVRQLRTAIPGVVRDRSQRHQPPFPDPVSVPSLRRIIRETQPDLIHVHGWIAFSVAAALTGQDIPLLLSAREYTYFCATRMMLYKGLPCSGPRPLKCLGCASDYYGVAKGVVTAACVAASRPLLVRKTNGLHSVSTYVHDVTLEFLCGGSEAASERDLLQQTIPSVLEDESPNGTPIAAILERLPKESYILFVGAFRKPKGLDVLFDAYRRLQSPPPLVLMGTIKRDSPERFPDGAVVITDVPHAAVMAAWDGAMFGVMPSLWPEPFGTVLAEAMSKGRPIIGTQVGGHADIVDEDSGILVPQGDVAALTEAMRSLIADPERRKRMGRAAHERAKMFAAESVLPRFEQVYRDMLALHGRDSGP